MKFIFQFWKELLQGERHGGRPALQAARPHLLREPRGDAQGRRVPHRQVRPGHHQRRVLVRGARRHAGLQLRALQLLRGHVRAELLQVPAGRFARLRVAAKQGIDARVHRGRALGSEGAGAGRQGRGGAGRRCRR